MPEVLTLREDQELLAEEARDAYRAGHSQVIVQAETGFGKTTMFTDFAQTSIRKGYTCHVFAHLNELIDQIAERFDRYGLRYGLMQGGKHIRPEEALQICSIQTYCRRLDRVVPPDLVIFDEAHHCVANSYQDVVRWAQKMNGAHVLGVTATPMRTDGKGLSTAGYTSLVKGPTTKTLIERGSMVKVAIYTRPGSFINAGRSREYTVTEAEEIAEKADIFGNTVSEYQRVAMGLLAVAFFASVRHATKGAQAFNDVGIPAAVLYGDMPKDERKRLFKAFLNREILVLCNCNLIAEGVDVPGIECVIFAKPSKSLIHYKQGIGRGTRPAPGKDYCVMIDQVGLYEQFGPPDRHIDWTLESGAVLAPIEKLKQCKQCLRWVAQNARQCEYCGAKFGTGGGGGREVTTADGQLLLVTEDLVLRPKEDKRKSLTRRLDQTARTLEDFKAIEKERGYLPGWAEVAHRRSKQTAEKKKNLPPKRGDRF